MGKFYSIISSLLIVLWSSAAFGQTGYEWWLDNDVSDRHSGTFPGDRLELQVDISGMPEGLHDFTCRINRNDSTWGSVYHKTLLIPASKGNHTAEAYEYWIDDKYAAKETGSLSDGVNAYTVDLKDLSEGLHRLSYRVHTRNGVWGSTYSQYFLIPASKTDRTAQAYEYWIDDDYNAKISGQLVDGVSSYMIDFDQIKVGLHRFNYRIGNAAGDWGAPFTKYFYCVSKDNTFTEYEYWIDESYSERKQRKTEGNPESFEVDLSDLDISKGKHWFNLHVRDHKGEWGPIYRELIPQFNNEARNAIIGYRHLVNDIDLGYVDLKPTTSETIYFETVLPERSILIGSKNNETSMSDSVRTASVRYVVQLRSEVGWINPVCWDLNLESLISERVKISYNGRYISMSTEGADTEIRYTVSGTNSIEESTYAEAFDIHGLGTVNAWTSKPGYQDSEKVELVVDHYADESHAETSAEGLLESAFEWSGVDLPNSMEEFLVEGRLNEADYGFIRSMGALRHLDIEKVAEARIPDGALRDTKLISISMPANLSEYGDSILAGSGVLCSVVWNSETQNVESRLTSGIANPNMFLYVPATTKVDDIRDCNVVTDGNAETVTLHYGSPYYAARDFHADRVSMTHEFRQSTEIGVCHGWETLVLPFSPQTVSHEKNGRIVPFAAWDGDVSTSKPFWLYRSVSDGWEMADAIEAGVPYILAMPNHPDYVESSILAGNVTFSANDVFLGPSSGQPEVTPWVSGMEFEGTFMPVGEENLLSLNVGSRADGLRPGSTFVANGTTLPFGAYVRGAAGRKVMPIFGDSNGLDFPTAYDSGILIESPAPGMLRISSGSERRIVVTTLTGMTIRTLHLNPGETVTLEGLTRDLYLVAGRKVIVR